MCGIAGIIQGSSRFDLGHVKKMTDAIAHRGPDGEGFWQNQEGHALFGHRRLSIIDLTSAGDQPLHYAGRFSIIHNGEIYNYIEIKEELLKKGYSFQSQTDTEVIIAAYACWGESCLDHFDGMFAFAIWDEQEKEIFVARDRFGEKPFFYFYDQAEKIFYFGSEMKAIWAAGVTRQPNLKMLFNFITIGYTDNPENPEETFDNRIKKLPAACFLKLNRHDDTPLQFIRYWEIDAGKQTKKIKDEEALEQFASLFYTSIKRRLRSDVPIGASISGGLDSSSILAALHELRALTYSPEAFTACFPGFEKNEEEYASLVSSTYKLRQHRVNVTGHEMMADWEKLCHHQEEPFGSSSIYAQFKVYELAEKQGIKVLLDGQGADETLGGYHKYYKWYWQELFRNSKLKKSGELEAARKLGIQEPFTFKNRIAAWFPSFASIVMERQYLLKSIRQEDLEKDFVRQQSNEAYYTPPDIFSLNGLLHFNTFIHGLEELLRYADRNAMAHGREVRLPFLSHELVSFIFSLPSTFKIRHGWTKWLLRETMKNKLPEKIVWRKDKTGFEPPQQKWMEDKIVEEAIRSARKKLVDQHILHPQVLDKPIRALGAHKADNYDWRYLSAASVLF